MGNESAAYIRKFDDENEGMSGEKATIEYMSLQTYDDLTLRIKTCLKKKH